MPDSLTLVLQTKDACDYSVQSCSKFSPESAESDSERSGYGLLLLPSVVPQSRPPSSDDYFLNVQ